MSTYKIKNVYYSEYLNTNTLISKLSNNTNVNLNANSILRSGKWVIDSLGNGVYVRSAINTAYGLNVYRSGDPYNCDVHLIAGNETDAKVNFMYHSATGFYMIKLTNYNLYLTATGSNVCWKPYSGEGNHTQMWEITLANSNTSKALNMPVNRNMLYSENEPWIRQYGCAVCCAADVASFYDSDQDYMPNDMISVGAAAEGSGLYNWGAVPKTTFNDRSSTNYLKVIKDEIDNNHPVIIHCTSNNNEHWVVAYKYTNNAASQSDIYVLDPTGPNGSSSSKESIIRTLPESMSYNNNLTTIDILRTTALK